MDLLKDLTDPQKQAVTHGEGPCLVLAGAGSGKTRVLTRRIAWLVREGVAPWRICAITFTNKAAEEMRHRVRTLVDARGILVGTFHSVCARLLREYAIDFGVSANYTIYDTADRRKVIKDAVARLELDSGVFAPAKVEAEISSAKNKLIGVEEFTRKARDLHGRGIAKIYAVYQEMMAVNKGLDFDDLLMIPALTLEKNKDLRDRLEERLSFVLIDEYQDTNRAQYVFARELTALRKNLFVVGDPDQSIYAWRGADLNNILQFERDHPDCAVVKLEQNYRSTKTILAAADGLISHNVQRKKKALWTDNVEGSKIKAFRCTGEYEEADQIAKLVKDELKGGAKPGDVAVFYRVNSLTRVLENALRTANIPYEIVRGVEFYNRQEIKDALSYLRVLVNPSDTVSLERILNVPPRGIGDTSIRKIVDFADREKVSMMDALHRVNETGATRAAAKVEEFLTLLNKLKPKQNEPVRDLMDRVMVTSGLRRHYTIEDDSENERIANLDELLNAAAEYDRGHPEGSLQEFLALASLTGDQDAYDAESGKVVLMTLHAAKGLEFPIVFIAGVEQGLLPHSRSLEEGDVEEERRLFFVGITRAMKRLYLTHSMYRSVRGFSERQTASDFLRELPKQAVESVDFSYGSASDDEEGDDGEHYVRESQFGGRYGRGFSPPPSRYNKSGRFGAGSTGLPPTPGRVVRPPPAPSLPKGTPLAQDKPADAPAGSTASGSTSSIEGLKEGSRVRHPTFGIGHIVSLETSGRPKAKIRFPGVGEKTIFLEFVKLERV